MRISFLLHNAYGIGGTIRSTFNLAAVLAAHHEVEIVSVLRHRTAPTMGTPPNVRLTPLVDLRTDSPATRATSPVTPCPPGSSPVRTAGTSSTAASPTSGSAGTWRPWTPT